MVAISMTMTMTDTSVKNRGYKAVNDKYKASLIQMSRELYCYQGYSGLGDPWHDKPDPMWQYSAKTITGLINYLDQEDITLESYAIFIFPLVHYSKYNKVGSLIYSKGHRSWMKKLRQYAGSADMFDEAADLLFQFFLLQVEYDKSHKLHINSSSVVVKDMEVTNSGKYCEPYHRLIDRIRQFHELGINPEIWLREKVRKCVEVYPDSSLLIKTIVNINGLEPTVDDLRIYTEDTWLEIRNFLGLSQDCEFIDDSIPKGWGSSGDDYEELKDVAKIGKDGYYYYSDGTQRRGKCHYSGNTKLIIGCNPENFKEFKDEWLDPRLLVAKPTWSEYNQWATYPGLWDSNGNAVNGRGRPVKWRSLGHKKAK